MSDLYPNVLDEVSKYIFTSKYARYLPEEERRETWDEAVARVQRMHTDKFKDTLSPVDLEEIDQAFSYVRDKRVVPSMRAMQFGGLPIEVNNARMYNCAVRHIDSIRSFAESFWLLLSGCGVGYGLTNRFLDRLPALVGPDDRTGIVQTYVIEDTIEGWADSIEALLSCYFVNTAYSGRKIVFDYSRIRPAGSPLKTSGGKAPGYEGLKAAHIKVKALLDEIIEVKHQRRLKTINAYDILMHCADAVLSGGVRRSACSVMFDPDDLDMMFAKTGNWYEENPQRGRSNNSVTLVRGEVSQDEFREVVARTREWGEPGFVFVDDKDMLYNPCQPAWAPILTRSGIRTMGDIKVGDEVWSETGWTKVVKKWSTGTKDVYRYTTPAGSFLGTENHRVVSGGTKVEARDAESIDVLPGPTVEVGDLSPESIMAGLLVGDGTVRGTGSRQVILCIGAGDAEYFDSEVAHLIGEQVSDLTWLVKSDVLVEELLPLPIREVPDRYFGGDPTTVASFLRGLYSANGSVVRNRITLKTTSPVLRAQVQMMLSSLGIRSYFTTNKSSEVVWENGKYTSVESYDINVTVDRGRFMEVVGFIQSRKCDLVDPNVRSHPGKSTFDIISVDYISTEEVFDITVDNDPHTYWTGGVNVSNCFEIGMMPVNEGGVCGVTFCNLTSINGSKVKSLKDFREAAWAASIIGTLQAAYTDFPYLSHEAEEMTKREALLGVSITAMMDHPAVLLDPEAQQNAAGVVVETNQEWAQKLGIRPAARATAIKPEGTSTLALGSMASGIHPAHARKMFRRVQANKLDNVYQYFKSINPGLCEESKWSANKTDDVITFPVELSEETMVKADLTAIDHLEIIRQTQRNWVDAGSTEYNNFDVSHNVSCTVIVQEDEWDDVILFLHGHQSSFAAVSLIPATGDKDYAQAPMEAVVTAEDEERFDKMLKNLIPIDYTYMVESDDNTAAQESVACGGGACEIV